MKKKIRFFLDLNRDPWLMMPTLLPIHHRISQLLFSKKTIQSVLCKNHTQTTAKAPILAAASAITGSV